MTLGEISLALDDDTSKPRVPEGFVAQDPWAMAQQMTLAPPPLAERVRRAKER